MLIFSPMRAFNSVDLPTLGRPTIATRPQRPAVVLSVSLTGQYRQHGRGGFLLGAAAARSLTRGVGMLFRDFATDDKRLLVIAAVHRLDRIDRQVHALPL